MREDSLAGQLLGVLRQQGRIMGAVLPGLALTMLHSTALDLPRADVIDALDSDHYRIQWIVGSYVLGNAVGLALTRFLGDRLGLRRAYLLGLFLFATAGSSCAAVSEVIWMTPLRLVQGLGAGLVLSVGMVLVWRAFPVRKEWAMAVYGMAVYLPALAGAVLGGLLVAWSSWRLIFLINLPLGCLVGLLAWGLPRDEPHPPTHGPFDWFGLLLLSATVVTLNVVVDLGQYWGWLVSPYFVPWFVGLLVSLAGFVAWGICAPASLVNFRVLARGHFALGLGIKVLFSINLYVLVGMLSGYAIGLRGYQWWQGSLVLLPALGTMLLSLLASIAFGNDGNRKFRLFLGLSVMSVATWLFSSLDVYTSKIWQAWVVALWGCGAGVVFGPALLTAFEGLSNEETLRTAGVFNIMRALPTFLIAGLLAAVLTQRTDVNDDWLRRNLRPSRPVVRQALEQPANSFVQHGRNAATAQRQAHAALGKWVHANARAFALRDVFEFLALVPAAGLVFVLLVRIPATRRPITPLDRRPPRRETAPGA